MKLKVDAGLRLQRNAAGAHYQYVPIVSLIVSLTRLAMAESSKQWRAVNGVLHASTNASPLPYELSGGLITRGLHKASS
ncbi:hypothetical protein [uncultured Sulfitobacter sp.]|uniref:hypothetical protein n=1 Tax=uncultured Sulfitobacter sp. TaxID=191468 RepID=UPI00262B4FF5|nr:hypothetical protein [uncultured Sulfitobacter sp.]